MSGPITFNQDFGESMERLGAKLGIQVETVAKKIIGELFSRIVNRSPVDTGRFRGNWNFSLDEPDTSYTEKNAVFGGVYSPQGGVIKNRVEQASIAGHVAYLSNGVPYAGVIEYGQYPNPPMYGSKKRGEDGMAIHVTGGYSMQAPQGVVRVSIAEIEGIVAEALSSK